MLIQMARDGGVSALSLAFVSATAGELTRIGLSASVEQAGAERSTFRSLRTANRNGIHMRYALL